MHWTAQSSICVTTRHMNASNGSGLLLRCCQDVDDYGGAPLRSEGVAPSYDAIASGGWAFVVVLVVGWLPIIVPVGGALSRFVAGFFVVDFADLVAVAAVTSGLLA